MENPKCDFCNSKSKDLSYSSCSHKNCSDCFYKICLYNKDLIQRFNLETKKNSKSKERTNKATDIIETDTKLQLKCLLCPIGILRYTKSEILKKLNTSLTDGSKSKWKKCSYHKIDIDVYCIQCKLMMCLKCFDHHKVIPVFSSHERDKNSIVNLSIPSKLCRIHDEALLKYYCSTCNDPICSLCKSTLHDGHNLICIRDYFLKKKDDIKSKFIRSTFPLEQIYNRIDETNSKLKRKMKKQVTHLRDRIHSVFQNLKEILIEIDNSIEFIEEQSDYNATFSKIIYKKLRDDLADWNSSVDYDKNFDYLEKIPKIFLLSKYNVDIGADLNKRVTYLEDFIEDEWDTKNNLSVFKVRKEIGYIEKVQTIYDHSSTVNKLIQLRDDKLASASADRTIRIWNPQENFRCMYILTKHTKPVTDLIELKDGRLVSSSMDSTITIWNLQESNYKPAKSIEFDNLSIQCLIQLEDGRIALGVNFNIKILDPKKDFKVTDVLNEHSGCIRCLIQLRDGRMVSCGDDKSIKIWRIEPKFECLFTLTNHNKCVYKVIQLRDGRLVSGSADKTIRIWNVEDNFTCTNILDDHDSPIWCLLQLKDCRLASGASDGKIMLWDEQSFNCTYTNSEETGSLKCLIQLRDGRLASGSRDNTIKIWM